MCYTYTYTYIYIFRVYFHWVSSRSKCSPFPGRLYGLIAGPRHFHTTDIGFSENNVYPFICFQKRGNFIFWSYKPHPYSWSTIFCSFFGGRGVVGVFVAVVGFAVFLIVVDVVGCCCYCCGCDLRLFHCVCVFVCGFVCFGRVFYVLFSVFLLWLFVAV